MAFSATHRIIWLDAFIGQEGECEAFKRHFTSHIDSLARVGESIDRCILALKENAVPFIFVYQTNEAMKEIQNNQQYKVIFISSGSLGERIVPNIHPQYAHVYSFYIFCGKISNYIDLVIEYADVLKIFDHEIDLLIRLMRDLSNELIREGRSFLTNNNPITAKEFFIRARNLEQAANNEDKLNPPIYERLRILGDENNPGLIQEAQRQIDDAIRQREEQRGQPYINETEGVEQGHVPPEGPDNDGVPPDGYHVNYIDMQQDSPVATEAT